MPDMPPLYWGVFWIKLWPMFYICLYRDVNGIVLLRIIIQRQRYVNLVLNNYGALTVNILGCFAVVTTKTFNFNCRLHQT